MKKLYSTSAKAVGGRNGHVESADGILKADVRMPKELGGTGGAYNPETLFAAGYAACFDSALNHVARMQKLPIKGSSVSADVSLYQTEAGGFQLGVALKVEILGLEAEAAQKLLHDAHQVCPYSNATRNNIEVSLQLLNVN